MKQPFRKVLSAAALAWACWATILAAGCSTVQNVRRDPSFTYGSLSAGGLAIGPITRRDQADFYAQEPLAQAVQDQFKLDCPELKVTPFAETKNVLGEANLATLRNAFFELGQLSGPDVEKLAPLESTARYVLFVDISRDEARDYDAVAEQPVTRQVWDSERRQYVSVWTETEYSRSRGSARSLSARFVVFDIPARREAWSASASVDDAYFNLGSATDRIPKVSASGGPAQADLFQEIASRMARKMRSAR